MRACRSAAHISCPCCLWLLANGARQSSLSHAGLGISLCSVGSNWSCFLPIHGPAGITQNNKQRFEFLFPARELCIITYDWLYYLHTDWLTLLLTDCRTTLSDHLSFPPHKSITNTEQCFSGLSLPHWCWETGRQATRCLEGWPLSSSAQDHWEPPAVPSWLNPERGKRRGRKGVG